MKYNCLVNHNGVYYAPGTEVPEGDAPVKEAPKPETKEPEKPQFTRTQIQQMNGADLRATAKDLGIEFGEDATNRELKQLIMSKLGI